MPASSSGASTLHALAHLLLEGARIDTSGRVWLQGRCEGGNWIWGDEVGICEMLPAALLLLLESHPEAAD